MPCLDPGPKNMTQTLFFWPVESCGFCSLFYKLLTMREGSTLSDFQGCWSLISYLKRAGKIRVIRGKASKDQHSSSRAVPRCGEGSRRLLQKESQMTLVKERESSCLQDKSEAFTSLKMSCIWQDSDFSSRRVREREEHCCLNPCHSKDRGRAP